jgi:threonine synthase
MEKFLGYRCSLCGTEYGPTQVTYLCPKDRGVLDVVLDYVAINRSTNPKGISSSSDCSIWRYVELLPVKDPGNLGTPLRSVGWTPVYEPIKMARELNLRQLWIKDESKNPTASFKDRASAVVLARAAEMGAQIVVTASTGNAGAALAGIAAATGQTAVIFAPKSAPPAKVAQLLIYGARVVLVDGNYDSAVQLSQQAAEEFGWYCRNTAYNPFTIEGKKTAALEIWEQVLSNQNLKRQLSIFVSVGDGNIISGLKKGFRELAELGWVKQMPRLFGVQADGSAAIANAFDAKTEEIMPVQANTIADSLSVDMPSDGLRALRAATQTGGAYLKVSDAEILSAIADLGRIAVFAEPAGAAAYAGLRAALNSGLIGAGDPVLVLNTGSGFKDVVAVKQAAGEAMVIEPTLDELKKAVEVWH